MILAADPCAHALRLPLDPALAAEASAACETFALSAAATALLNSLNNTAASDPPIFLARPPNSVRTWSSKFFTWPVRRVTIAASREI